jgi:hypothetical protein
MGEADEIGTHVQQLGLQESSLQPIAPLMPTIDHTYYAYERTDCTGSTSRVDSFKE